MNFQNINATMKTYKKQVKFLKNCVYSPIMDQNNISLFTLKMHTILIEYQNILKVINFPNMLIYLIRTNVESKEIKIKIAGSTSQHLIVITGVIQSADNCIVLEKEDRDMNI